MRMSYIYYYEYCQTINDNYWLYIDLNNYAQYFMNNNHDKKKYRKKKLLK